MFSLAIRYLNGWAMAAADGARKEQAEWPPHPDRVFMALAAAWFETGENPAEGEALRWLEILGPPAIAASDAEFRRATGGTRPTVSYVPVNDTRLGRKKPTSNNIGKLKDAGLNLLPEYRSRQPRGFPVAIPHEPLVHLIWQQANPGKHLSALERVVSKVTHIGHSASLVQMWIEEGNIAASWVPVPGVAQHRLRVPNTGRLEYLASRCNRDNVVAFADLTARSEASKGKEKKRLKQTITEQFGNRVPVSLRPEPGCWQGYMRYTPIPKPETRSSVFDPRLVVLALTGKRPSLPATLKLTDALRNTLMSTCPEQPPPEWFSGHTPDGKPTKEPHLALLPLPFVGSQHADGQVMGLGLALPAGLPPDEAARCLGPAINDENTGLPKAFKLFNGKWFECRVEIEIRERPPLNLRADTWTRASRIWASVTPVVLDRHFDGKDKWERTSESIKDACENIGLPRPEQVLLHPVSRAEGVPHAREFPCLIRKSDGGRRQHSHTTLIFKEPVRGPVLIGAGRFRGYGLCRPMDGRGHGHD